MVLFGVERCILDELIREVLLLLTLEADLVGADLVS